MLSTVSIALLTLATSVSAFVQGDCASLKDPALFLLSKTISPNAALACKGSELQLKNAGRYWGKQHGRNSSVVVYPLTAKDVSLAVLSSWATPLGKDLAFVSGAHAQTGASSAENGFLIDLSWMNSTEVLSKVQVDDVFIENAIAYQPGATWGKIQTDTGGSGWTAVGARMSSVGAGGFSTGGGIGFLAGSYGYAIDRLQAMEVVLMDGRIVTATRTNRYSDLFWALQGGNGQFGVVTKFWQSAVLEPSVSKVGIYYIDSSSSAAAIASTINFFNTNADPFALMYFTLAYATLPGQPTSLGPKLLLTLLQFPDPTDPSQRSFNETFAPVLANLTISSGRNLELPYSRLTAVLDPLFPYGFRRGFYGPQIRNVSTEYLTSAYEKYNSHVASLVAAGETPATAFWALQYMFPGLNGNLPPSNEATAWPHASSAHQTLFSPAWNKESNDATVLGDNDWFNQITYKEQEKWGGAPTYDYPNYMSPKVKASRVFGGNVKRLVAVKEKYDPDCRLHQGRVFATRECVRDGVANFFE
ncbi:FAD-binding domain-containing protein 46 [Elsinoe fawcettii]|nr:FAD-binding domain-containing protein 46 [Elsinoe fawcettii]